MGVGRRAAGWLLAAYLLSGSAGAEELQGEWIELIPDDRAGWTPANLLAPLAGLLRGDPDYWYEPRTLRIDSSPPGAVIDVFYVRRGFQKGYGQADAPVQVRLPSRVEAGSHDTVTVRALLDGYRATEVRVEVRSSQDEVLVELAPLPNELLALTHLSLAGRASVGLVTREAPTVRVRDVEDGLQVVLVATALGQAASSVEGVRGALIEELRAQQLGEDLVLRLSLAESVAASPVEVRSRQSYDPVRGTHLFAVDLVPPDAGESVARARAALARLGPSEVDDCARRWDRHLREQLEPADLAKALAARGEFTDRYMRAAMRRLGEVSSGGAVSLVDGSSFRVSVPIELMAAASQAHEVEGYLALLRGLVRELERPRDRRPALRGLLAPQLSPSAFDALLDEADSIERRCRAR